jgi:hypothetical protein
MIPIATSVASFVLGYRPRTGAKVGRAALWLACLTLSLAGPWNAAWAAELGRPTGRVILTVSGAIKNTNGDGIAELDRQILESLPMTRLKTTTPWTDGVRTFTGPLVRDLLDFVGATGTRIKARAINDYTVEILVRDLLADRVIMAMTMDGKRLRVRSKGPLWIIYPWSENQDLQNIEIFAKSIWQLKAIEVEE